MLGRKKPVRWVVVLGALLFVPLACAKQGEGERCDLEKAGHSDCDDGLQCLEVVDAVFRCCPPIDAPISDSRCDRSRTPVSGTGGTAGTGGTSALGGSAGDGSETTSSGGTSDAGAASGAGGEPAGASSAGADPGGQGGAEPSGAGAGGQESSDE